MPTYHDFGIIRTDSESDNYMPSEYSSSEAMRIVPYPRVYVKLPARIVDEYDGADGSARFEVETSLFDETEVECSIDDWSTVVSVSGGIVEFTSLTAGDYVMKVRVQRSGAEWQLSIPFTIYNVGNYAEQYRMTFKDNYNDDEWQLSIFKKDLDPETQIIDICGGPNPVVIDWGFDSQEDYFTGSTMPSKATIQLLVEKDGQFEELYTNTDPFTYKVEVYRNGVAFWRGWFIGNTYQYPLRNVPYVLNIVATDGLGLLSGRFAVSGNRDTDRQCWNHDKITITELLWIIKRELRFGNSATGPLNNDRIFYYLQHFPADHNDDYPALFSETLDLREICSQDPLKPDSLMTIIEKVLAPHFARFVRIGKDWSVTHKLRHASDVEEAYRQTWFETFAKGAFGGLIPAVGGISDDPAPDNSWRNNDQFVYLTKLIGNVVISHETKRNDTIWTYKFLREKLTPTSAVRKIGNNDPGWFANYTNIVVLTAQSPSPQSTVDIFGGRFTGRAVIGVPGREDTGEAPIPGYLGLEPVKLVRHSSSDYRCRFRIKFDSYNGPSIFDNIFIQLFAGGFYLKWSYSGILTTDTWEEIDWGADDFDTFTVEILGTDPADFDEAQKRHEYVTPVLPTAILETEHVGFRILNTTGDSPGNVIFIDALNIIREWVLYEDDQIVQVLSDEVYEEVVLRGDESRDDEQSYELSYWNGPTVDGCVVSRRNIVSTGFDDPLQNILYNGQSYNRVEYWANLIRSAISTRRMSIAAHIKGLIVPYAQPTYDGKQFYLVSETVECKSNISKINIIEMPENYENIDPGWTIMRFNAQAEQFNDIPNSVKFAIIFDLEDSSCVVDWGDGNSETYSTGIGAIIVQPYHEYASSAVYTVKVQPETNLIVTIDCAGDIGDSPSRNLVDAVQFGSTLVYCLFNDNPVEAISVGTLPHDITSLQLYGASLDETAVNAILVKLDSFGTYSGSVDLQAQTTSAAPSGDGVTAKTNLFTRSWTVQTD